MWAAATPQLQLTATRSNVGPECQPQEPGGAVGARPLSPFLQGMMPPDPGLRVSGPAGGPGPALLPPRLWAVALTGEGDK